MDEAKKKRRTKAQKEQAHRLRALVSIIILLAVAAVIFVYTDTAALKRAFLSFSASDIDLSADISSADIPVPPSMPEEPYLDVYFFDVGQGDSALLVSPSGKTMLVDAGDAEHVLKLARYLDRVGVDRIDALVATHPHADHIGGMRQMILNYDIGAFYMPDAEYTSTAYEGMIAALWDRSVDSTVLTAGITDKIVWDDDVTVDVLSPFAQNDFADLNDQSLILRVTYAGHTLLLTGDAGPEAENAAINILGPDAFRAEIIKMPHHGSEWASPKFFIDAVQPKAAIISCGRNNSYGHPDDAVLDLLKDCGADVYRTDKNGAIRVIITAEDVLFTSVTRRK